MPTLPPSNNTTPLTYLRKKNNTKVNKASEAAEGRGEEEGRKEGRGRHVLENFRMLVPQSLS